MPLHALNTWLAAHGLAMPNLGDIDAQTVAGAISTGTHGTGVAYRLLASCVEAVTLVTGTGEVVRCSTRSDAGLFPAARLGIGALGVLVEVTLRCVRRVHAAAPTSGRCRWPRCSPGSTSDIAGNDHVEFYWFPYTDRAQLKRNNRVPADDRPLSRVPRLAGRRVPGQHRLRRAPAGWAGRSRRRSRRSARSPHGP